MERYESYNDSGVDWIGEIPSAWTKKRLKYLIEKLESGVSVNSIDVPVSGDAFGILKTSCVYNYEFNPSENKQILPSEIERAKITPKAGEIIISRMNTPDLVGASGYVSENYPNLFLPDRLWQTKFKQNIDIDTRWLSFILKSLRFRNLLSVLATGTSPSMKNLTQEDFLNTEIPWPAEQEQTEIANHLDQKTAEIDALIEQKERLLALYEEEKAAIINQAVTRGIEPDVPMKDSGIDWLGEVPEGWKFKKLKYLIEKLESGISVNSIDMPTTEDSYGILKTSCVYNYRFEPNENKEILISEVGRAKVNPRKGEVIISRMNTPELVGASGYVENTHNNLFLPDRLWQTNFFPNLNLNKKWLSFILKSVRFRNLLSMLATGTSPSMKNLAQEDFLNIQIPWISYNEQEGIVNHIEDETSRIDLKIEKTKRIIKLQKEYRTALISEVVTGKIKVPNFEHEEATE